MHRGLVFCSTSWRFCTVRAEVAFTRYPILKLRPVLWTVKQLNKAEQKQRQVHQRLINAFFSIPHACVISTDAQSVSVWCQQVVTCQSLGQQPYCNAFETTSGQKIFVAILYNIKGLHLTQLGIIFRDLCSSGTDAVARPMIFSGISSAISFFGKLFQPEIYYLCWRFLAVNTSIASLLLRTFCGATQSEVIALIAAWQTPHKLFLVSAALERPGNTSEHFSSFCADIERHLLPFYCDLSPSLPLKHWGMSTILSTSDQAMP